MTVKQKYNSNNWRTAWKEHYIHKWFAKRMQTAIEEYTTKLADNHRANSIVYYRGVMFNPTGTKVVSSNLYEVPENSEVGDILDRQIRIKQDIEDATGMLTYVLNFCDDALDISYLMGNYQEMVNGRLDDFKKANQDKFQAFKKYELLKDLI